MIGFWTRDVAAEGGRRPPLGACGPMPRATRSISWPEALVIPEGLKPSIGSVAHGVTRHPVPCVEQPWEELQQPEGARVGRANEPLHMPEARHHRFFVRSLGEFCEQLKAADDDEAESELEDA